MGDLCCPFCGEKSENEYGLMYHLESVHLEGESPFMPKDDLTTHEQDLRPLEVTPALEESLAFVPCPSKGCGENIMLEELENHMSMHEIENTEENLHEDSNTNKRLRTPDSDSEIKFDTRLPPAIRNLTGHDSSVSSSSSSRQEIAKAGWRELLNMPSSRAKISTPTEPRRSHRRLGRSELGPYAHEKQMPIWLRRLLEADGNFQTIKEISLLGDSKIRILENHVSGVISVVERLLQQDHTTEYAFTCHPCVQHVSKLKKEGGFCGYRNIQMMTSYINGTKSQGFYHFDGKLPTIFQIQDFIECAWDLGINAQGRLETGGIRGTRKYIGTPEAQAMFISLNIFCNAQGLKSKGNLRADQLLLRYVEDYYASGCENLKDKVRATKLGPLYFQQPGHSMTIIGFEKKKDGSANILVFDPMFHDSNEIIQLIGKNFYHKSPEALLKAYQRPVRYLRRYNEFEVLRLAPPDSTSRG